MSVLVASDLMVSAKLGSDLVPVLRDFSLNLEPGRVVGLVGESGAGKSTGGRLLFGGRDLVGMPFDARRALLGREIAFIPQEPLSALNPVLTIGQQLDEHLRRLGLASPRERRTRALDLLETVHLPRGVNLLR